MGGGKNEGFKMAVLFFFFAENDYLCSVFLPSYIETVGIRGLRIYVHCSQEHFAFRNFNE